MINTCRTFERRDQGDQVVMIEAMHRALVGARVPRMSSWGMCLDRVVSVVYTGIRSHR